ncbi:SprB repeat-containing protein [Microbulbifer discodermiae]|uniref:SprB repeat-containing protein n=1 Tax=Microbulbifer sp. 2201CG32-9 TaxID=3232309 RepID=UPI00345B6378
MGSTPGSYPLTSEQLAGLDGINNTFTSENLAARGDVPGPPFSSDDLLGLTDYVPMSGASLSKTSVTNENIALVGTSRTLSSGTITASVSGGTGNYTYTWQKVSGTTLSQSGSGSSVSLTHTSSGGVSVTAVYRCRITDGVGTITTNNIAINFTHYRLNTGAITNEVAIDYAPATVTATVFVNRNGTASGTGYWIAPASSTVGDLFDVYFNITLGTVSSGSPTTTPLTINTQRWQSVTASQSRPDKPGLSKVADVRVRIRKKSGGGYLFDKTVRISAIVESDWL